MSAVRHKFGTSEVAPLVPRPETGRQRPSTTRRACLPANARPCAALQSTPWANAIVRGSRELSEAEKSAFRLITELDRPSHDSAGGAFMSLLEMADQLGLHEDHLRETLRKLESRGLVHRLDAGRRSYLFATLPDSINQGADGLHDTESRRRWRREQTAFLDFQLRGGTSKKAEQVCPDDCLLSCGLRANHSVES
jgi:hypothetical protein